MAGSEDSLAQGSERGEQLALRDNPEEAAAEVRSLRQLVAEAQREEGAEGQGTRPKANLRGKGGERAIVPLEKSAEGTSLEEWERQIIKECQYRYTEDDRTRIIFALKSTDSGIHANFSAIDPSIWTWEDFMHILGSLAPARRGCSGHGYLPCTMSLRRYPTQTWSDFVVSASYLRVFNELCASKQTAITTWHRMTVLQVMETVAPAGAAKIWKNPHSQEWNLKEVEKIGNLIDIHAHVSDWVINHPQEDEAFRETIPVREGEEEEALKTSSTAGRPIHVEKYCSTHRQCHHDTSECYSNPVNKRDIPGISTRQNQRGRGRGRGTPAHGGGHERVEVEAWPRKRLRAKSRKRKRRQRSLLFCVWSEGSLRESVRRKEKDSHQLGRILANKRGEANADIREIDQRVDSPGKSDELQVLPCGSDLASYMIAHFMIGTVPTRGLIDWSCPKCCETAS
ncbi:hypothetical protein C7M84_000881 [Penaeus vannamei]|uniref:Uncharacterized protein n=1 Tax=Penaeus vannamei TaxID=6689 RepID=A0A3R7PAS9_PENVA|nr:hypothetical protein C7M84_000881 [Penaeus vannamei]